MGDKNKQKDLDEKEIKKTEAEANDEAIAGNEADANAEAKAENEAGANAENAEGANGETKAENAEATADAEETSSADDKYKKQIEELNDKCLRQMAEFENFRNRTDKEKQQMFETGAKSVIEKILPVVDNFERGLDALTDEDKDSKFAEGMKMIYKQLMDELEKMEVKPIEAVGAEFDPNLHNAVMQSESDEYESGIVSQELQKGYTYRDQVVRHSMVAVVS